MLKTHGDMPYITPQRRMKQQHQTQASFIASVLKKIARTLPHSNINNKHQLPTYSLFQTNIEISPGSCFFCKCKTLSFQAEQVTTSNLDSFFFHSKT